MFYPLEKDTESKFWHGARHIVHFVGICGSGKTTLSNRLVNRCFAHGIIPKGTIDWDPHVADDLYLTKRAFRRDLDLAMADDPYNIDIQSKIIDHSLQLINQWIDSDVNLVVLDRFIESYDYLSAKDIQKVQSALAASGFTVIQVLLVIGLNISRLDQIAERLQQTRKYRPSQWWNSGPGTIELFAAEEMKCQTTYRLYCETSPFFTAVIDTTQMQWDSYEKAIVNELMLQKRVRSEPWNVSMIEHVSNAYPINGPSARCRMSRPGFNWYATMHSDFYRK